MLIQLEEWLLDTETREITGPTGRVRLRPQVFKTLGFLVQRAPAVVTKGELLAQVWEGQAVSDGAIAQVIRELRSIFDDDPGAPRFIATRHRQGYQLISSVHEVPIDREVPAAEPSLDEKEPANVVSGGSARQPVERRPSRNPPGRQVGVVLAVAMAMMGLVALGLYFRAPAPPGVETGWPVRSQAAGHLVRGLEAARRLDSAAAIEHLGAALSAEYTPRLSAQIARLLIQRGLVNDARRILVQLTRGQESSTRRDQLFADAIMAEMEGRFTEASRLYSLVVEIQPDDIDFALALWETDTSRLRAPANTEQLSYERRLLIAAQAAGRADQPEEQLERAEVAIRTAEQHSPSLVPWAQIERGTALRSLGRIEESMTAYQDAAQSLQRLGEVRAASRSLGLGVDNAAILRRTEDLREMLGSYEVLVDKAEDPWQEARLTFMKGRLAAIEGDQAVAAELFGFAAQRSKALGSWNLGATALGNRADALQKLGELDAAEAELREAVRWAESSQHSKLIGQASINLANYFLRRNNIEQAKVHYERALRRFRQSRYVRGEAAALVNLARLARSEGLSERAVELNAAAGQRFRQMNLTRGEGVALFQAAEAELDLGHLIASKRFANEGLELFRQAGADSYEAASLALLARLALRAANPRRAAELLDSSVLPASQTVETRARVQCVRARRAREQGEVEVARQLLREVLETIQDPYDTAHALLLHLEVAYLDLDRGRPVIAEQTGRRVLGIAERGADVRLRRQASLLIIEALLAQGNWQASRRQLLYTRPLIEIAPDFQDRLIFGLMEARVESVFRRRRPHLAEDQTVPTAIDTNSLERLNWILDTARESGHQLLVFEARVELVREGALNQQEIHQLRRELGENGFGRLLARLETLVKARK